MPTISVSVALVLAMICVALLIYFVYHVSRMIQSSSTVRRAHEDTARVIAALVAIEASDDIFAVDSADER